MKFADYLIFASYLAGVLAIGLGVSRRRAGADEYHVASRSLRWGSAGISIMVTLFSAVNFTAFTGEVYEHGLYVLLTLPAFAVVAWPVAAKVIPALCRARPVSVYGFLEARFDRRVRLLGSAMFLLWRLVWMATILYATAKFMAPVTGLSAGWLIALSGGICTAYTAVGGMRAVVVTDIAQFAVLFGGLAAALAAMVAQHGLGGLVRSAHAAGALRPFAPFDPGIFSFDPTLRMSLWTCVIGGSVAFLARYSVDQMVAQRYFASRSVRDAQAGFALNIAAAVLALLCLAALGLAVDVHNRAAGSPFGAGSPIQALARFVLDMPTGVRGLLVAALLASTMSSMDSGIHSCTTALALDFRLRGPGREAAGGIAGVRWLTFGLGVLTMVLAVFVGRLGSVFEIANKVVNGFGSPLLALFLVGSMGRWVNPRGVFWGGVAGLALSGWVSFGLGRLALHYYAVVNLLGTVALCLAFSIRTWPAGPASSPRTPPARSGSHRAGA